MRQMSQERQDKLITLFKEHKTGSIVVCPVEPETTPRWVDDDGNSRIYVGPGGVAIDVAMTWDKLVTDRRLKSDPPNFRWYVEDFLAWIPEFCEGSAEDEDAEDVEDAEDPEILDPHATDPDYQVPNFIPLPPPSDEEGEDDDYFSTAMAHTQRATRRKILEGLRDIVAYTRKDRVLNHLRRVSTYAQAAGDFLTTLDDLATDTAGLPKLKHGLDFTSPNDRETSALRAMEKMVACSRQKKPEDELEILLRLRAMVSAEEAQRLAPKIERLLAQVIEEDINPVPDTVPRSATQSYGDMLDINEKPFEEA